MASSNGNHRNGKPAESTGSNAQRAIPSNLSVDASRILRPETIRFLREIAATPAVIECPVSLSRQEVSGLLDLIENRWIISQAWARTLDWCIRYARMAQRMAERSGFPGYARWLDRYRIQPMRRLRDDLALDSAAAIPDQLLAEAG